MLVSRVLVDRLVSFNGERLRSVFEERLTGITGEIIAHRREEVGNALDALRGQYPDYVAALEVRFLRQSALRQEMGRYQALFEEGLIPQELYDDLKRGMTGTRAAEHRPRFEIGLDTHRLIERLDMLSGLEVDVLRLYVEGKSYQEIRKAQQDVLKELTDCEKIILNPDAVNVRLNPRLSKLEQFYVEAYLGELMRLDSIQGQLTDLGGKGIRGLVTGREKAETAGLGDRGREPRR